MKKTKTTKQAKEMVCPTCGTCPTCGSTREIVVLPAAPCPLPHYPAYDWTWRPWISPVYCGTGTGITANGDAVTVTYY
jgi:hypothetical protein